MYHIKIYIVDEFSDRTPQYSSTGDFFITDFMWENAYNMDFK